MIFSTAEVEDLVIVGLQTNAQDFLFRHEFSSFRFLQASVHVFRVSSLTKPRLDNAFGCVSNITPQRRRQR
jgi:hypothetical protein